MMNDESAYQSVGAAQSPRQAAPHVTQPLSQLGHSPLVVNNGPPLDINHLLDERINHLFE